MKNGAIELYTNQPLEEVGLDNILSGGLYDYKVNLWVERAKLRAEISWVPVLGALQLEDGDVLLLIRGCNPQLIGLATSSMGSSSVKYALKAGCDQFLYQVRGMGQGDYLRVRSESKALSLRQDYRLTNAGLKLASTRRNISWQALHYQNWSAICDLVEEWDGNDTSLQLPEVPEAFFEKC